MVYKFPFVSDVVAVFTFFFLETIRRNQSLHIQPFSGQVGAKGESLPSGYSFSVTKIPWQQFSADSRESRSTDAVYKTVMDKGDREAYTYLLKELLITTHMAKLGHENIVKLIGLGGEAGLDSPPTLALEWAEYGTLGDLYSSPILLSEYQMKRHLLLDIAEGLLALHSVNIVHSDIKPANILIFKHPRRKMVAKLSDFGFSLLGIDEGLPTQKLEGYSHHWAAPEAEDEIPWESLSFTDVYSFGLVVWQTILNGRFPLASPRYKDGAELTKIDLWRLKKGTHTEIASAYGLDLEKQTKSGGSHPIYQFDPAKEILLQMVEESMSMLGDAVFPISERSVMMSLFDIALSTRPQSRRLDSCRILLGYDIPRLPGVSLAESIVWLLIPDMLVENTGNPTILLAGLIGIEPSQS